MNDALLRLFVAIELPEDTRQRIRSVIEGLRGQGVEGVRWVRPEGVHLTLKFLGNTPEERVHSVVDAMRTAAQGIAPFVLRIQGAGAFPHMRAPRVLWLGIHGDVEPLVEFHGRLEQALESHGFPRDRRAFSPHLTLGRVDGRLSPDLLGRLSLGIEGIRGFGFPQVAVAAISLMESKLDTTGAVYRRKSQTPLGDDLAGPG